MKFIFSLFSLSLILLISCSADKSVPVLDGEYWQVTAMPDLGFISSIWLIL